MKGDQKNGSIDLVSQKVNNRLLQTKCCLAILQQK